MLNTPLNWNKYQAIQETNEGPIKWGAITARGAILVPDDYFVQLKYLF